MAVDASARVALLTGAAGGFGTILTNVLLRAGLRVVGTDIAEDGLQRLLDAHPDAGDRLHVVPGDVGREADCKRVVAEAVARCGGLHVVINNAGLGVSAIRADAEANHPTLEELTPALWHRFFDVNVHGPYYMTRAALPHLKAAGWGRVINVTTSFRTMLRVLPYGANKAALECMSAIWAEELRPSGITVNIVVPGGPADTPIVGDHSGWRRDQMIRPEVMGPPIAWLCSLEAGEITGQRFIAARWDATLAPADASAACGAPIGWPELAEATAVWPAG